MTFRPRQAKHAAVNGWLPCGEQISRVETINGISHRRPGGIGLGALSRSTPLVMQDTSGAEHIQTRLLAVGNYLLESRSVPMKGAVSVSPKRLLIPGFGSLNAVAPRSFRNGVQRVSRLRLNAEGKGFEPLRRGYRPLVFKTSSFGRSDNLPYGE